MKVDMRIRDFMTGMIVRSFSCHRKLRPMTPKNAPRKSTVNYKDAVPSGVSSPSLASSMVTIGWMASSV